MSQIEFLIGNGSIRIFDSSGVNVTSYSEFIDNPNLVASPPEMEGTIAALELLYGSSSFRNLLSNLSPQNALWIDLAPSSSGGVRVPAASQISMSEYATKDPRLASVAGFVSIEPDGVFSMVNALGEIVDLPYARILAHEISHAVLDTLDPDTPLTGTSPISRAAYLGTAAVFENEVVSQLESLGHSMGGFRTSYASVSNADMPGASVSTIGELTGNVAGMMGMPGLSATFGYEVDLVLFDDETLSIDGHSIYGPGHDIDTRYNTETVDDLIISRSDANNTISTGSGTDFVYGGAGNDTIFGGDGGDFIAGGIGVDALFGGAGNDWIAFGALDEFVFGGTGRDLGYVVFEDGVKVDMGLQSLEVLIGGLSADSIVFWGAEEQMAAGGEGDDTFTLDFTGEDGLRTVWGGAGADQIIASSPGLLRVMVATVTGLTAETFPLFDKAMLGLGESFSWEEVDLLLLNPDGSDRIFIDIGEGAQMAQVSDLQAQVVVNVGDSSGDILVPVTTISYQSDTTFGAPEWQGVEAGYHQVSGYAGGYTGQMFASMRVVDDELVVFEHKIGETTYITAQEIGWEEIDGEPVVTQALALGIGLFGDGWDGEHDTVYDLSAAKGASGWVELGEDEFIRAHYFNSEAETPVLAGGSWLFLNGGLGEGGSIANGGAISADMSGLTAPDLSDWLLAA